MAKTQATKVKICGLTRPEDIDYVNEAMPDYAGFVFASGRRHVGYEQAALLKSKLSADILSVGVFVNEEMSFVERLCRDNIIDLVQLHGDEDEDYITNVRNVLDKPIIKAVRVREKSNISPTSADYELYDAYNKDMFGGTGEVFNWDFVKGYKKPFFLAGGLNADNIKRAICEAHPYCVDISSGVEINGAKDKDKIIKIIKIVRSMCI